MIGGDPGAIRTMATTIRARADELADGGARLRRAADAEWQSDAAEVFRSRLADVGGQHESVVAEIREAADRLDQLAATLAERQQDLLTLLHDAGRTLDDARDLLARGVDDLVSDARGLWERVT